MSATGWAYFVPYQSDVNAALQELRQEIFQCELYRDPRTGEDHRSLFDNLPLSPETRRRLEETKRAEGIDQTPRFVSKPATISELVRQAAESGTHSILDISHIAPVTEFGALSPLTEPQLLALFGTLQPTRAKLDRWRRRIESVHEPLLYRRWEGIYITVYKDGTPDELYFEGASGD